MEKTLCGFIDHYPTEEFTKVKQKFKIQEYTHPRMKTTRSQHLG